MIRRALSTLAALALVVGAVPALAGAAQVGATASPLLSRGPEATRITTATGSDAEFTCQVGLDVEDGVPVVCYDPYQIRHAYGIDKLIAAGATGSGKTIVIIDAFQSPNIVDELNTFDSVWQLPGLNGLGAKSNAKLGTFRQIAPEGLTKFNPGDSDMVGWAQEISLDVQWAHAIAPGANIVLDLARSDQDADILAATKYAVDHHLGDVISQSFGENESCVDPKIDAAQHQVFAKATLLGITLFASTGDEGAAQLTCDSDGVNVLNWTKAVSSPANDPLVTAVGGTELHAANYCIASLGCNPKTNPAAGTYQGEIAWNEPDFGAASGGGYSVLYPEPSYQRSVVTGKALGVPDVSYNAAILHGVMTYLDIPDTIPADQPDVTNGDLAGWFLFGGTSAGSPQWSAITAIADQKAHRDLGLINSALYQIGGSAKTYAAALHDITVGNNSVVEPDIYGNPVSVAGFKAGKGWDATTGLGSPSAQLVDYLIKYTSPSYGIPAFGVPGPYFWHGPFFGRSRPH